MERLASEAASGAAELPPAAEASAADPAALPNPAPPPHPARLPGPGSALEQHPGPKRIVAAAEALPNPAALPEPHAAAQQEPGCGRGCAACSAPETASPAALGACSASGGAAFGAAAAALHETPGIPRSGRQQCAAVLACVPRAEPGAQQAADGPRSFGACEAEHAAGAAGRCGAQSSGGAALRSESSGAAVSASALPAQVREQPAAERAGPAERSDAAQPAGAPAKPGSAAAAARAAAEDAFSSKSPARNLEASPRPGGKPCGAVGARAKARAPPRNRACPCASCKRYKECCGPVAATAARRVSAAPAPAELGRQMATLYV